MYESHPLVARDLLKNVPRLQAVAEVIGYQSKGYDGSGLPDGGPRGQAIPLGARILKVALDFDAESLATTDAFQAFHRLKARSERYDPQVLEALEPIVANDFGIRASQVSVKELEKGMVFAADVRSVHGQILVAKGQEVTPSLCWRLLNFAGKVQEPLLVTRLRTDSKNDLQVVLGGEHGGP